MSINSTTFSDEASTFIYPILPHLLQMKPKRKRSLPGNPDPDAEVIALSPTTLMTTNRFVCEVCDKGFRRDQNLQLHRRGHNLPWKLKQRNNKEVMRKKVYVCPEPLCVHHHPSRALGDLTGIKKHFCRKHGEKSFQCEKCSKRYAVHSDWKAHVKSCGTREYRCDCGTLFPRKDSFMTHRAFCTALAEESARVIASASTVSFSGNGRPSPTTPTPIDHLSWAPSSLTSSSTTTTAHDQMMVPPQYLFHLQPAPPCLLPAPAISATALLQKATYSTGTLAGRAGSSLGSFHGLDIEWGGDVLLARGGRAVLQEDVKEITTTREFLGETAGRPATPWLPAFPSAVAGGGGGGGGGVGPERLGLSWECMGPMLKQPIAAFGAAHYYNSAWFDY